jgi:hypothetical protein
MYRKQTLKMSHKDNVFLRLLRFGLLDRNTIGNVKSVLVIALSRREHGFESRRARQLDQWVSGNAENHAQ